MKNNSICIFNNSLFDIEIYYDNFKTIKDLKNYYNEINTILIDLKNKTIFIDIDNTLYHIPRDNCIFKSCEKRLELFKQEVSEDETVDNLIINEGDMIKISFNELINNLTKDTKSRIVAFDPIAYTMY